MHAGNLPPPDVVLQRATADQDAAGAEPRSGASVSQASSRRPRFFSRAIRPM